MAALQQHHGLHFITAIVRIDRETILYRTFEVFSWSSLVPLFEYAEWNAALNCIDELFAIHNGHESTGTSGTFCEVDRADTPWNHGMAERSSVYFAPFLREDSDEDEHSVEY